MKTLDEMISIMQAAKEGKEIQWRFVIRTEDGWDACTPTTRMWDWFGCDYRVKPVEPRRIFVVTYSNGLLSKCIDDSPNFPSGEFIELTPEIRKALNL